MKRLFLCATLLWMGPSHAQEMDASLIHEEFDILAQGHTIANGVAAPDGAYPGAVKLIFRNPTAPDGSAIPGGGCSGTLIAPKLILTSGHCVIRGDLLPHAQVEVYFHKLPNHPAEMMRVPLHGGNLAIASEYRVLRTKPDFIDVTANSVFSQEWSSIQGASPTWSRIYHLPGYQSAAKSDLALIKLPQAPQGSGARVTSLATDEDVAKIPTIHISGYGMIKDASVTPVRLVSSSRLMHGAVRLMTRDDFAGLQEEHDSFSDRYTALYGRLLVGDKFEAVSVCFGDSGGATYLTMNRTNLGDPELLRVVGVNSRINPGPHDFSQIDFNDEFDDEGKRILHDADKCLRLGVGSFVTSVPANRVVIDEMAAALGETL